MQIKDTIPIIIASIVGGLANIGDLFSNIIFPVKDNFSINQISLFILLLILLSACFLFFYISLERSTRKTPLKLKVTKYFMITPLCIALILGVGLILPTTINADFNASSVQPIIFNQKVELLNKEIKLAEIKLAEKQLDLELQKNQNLIFQNNSSNNPQKK